MGREHLTRMDIDTRWAYGEHARRLQRAHPEQWPVFWAAYMLLLGESWWEGQRVTLAHAWSPTMPCTIEDASKALHDAGLVDHTSRVTRAAWREWVEPVLGRVERMRDNASAGGKARAAKAGRNRGRFTSGSPAGDQPAAGTSRPPADHQPMAGNSTSRPPAAHQQATSGDQPSASHHSQPSQPAFSARAREVAPLPLDLEREGLPHLSLELVHQAEQLVGMTFLQASPKVQTEMDRLAERWPSEQVGSAMAAIAGGLNGSMPSWPQLVYGARNVLEPLPTGRQARASLDEQERVQLERKRARNTMRERAYQRGEITEQELRRLREHDLLPGEEARA